MILNNIPQADHLLAELEFTTSRSSGPGGQNVNKVNSKVTVKFDVAHSSLLTDEQKTIILQKLSSRITNDGVLVLTTQEKRSQLQNKEEVIAKLNQLLIIAFTPRKMRRATKPSKAAKKKRVDEKKSHSKKKQWRQRPE